MSDTPRSPPLKPISRCLGALCRAPDRATLRAIRSALPPAQRPHLLSARVQRETLHLSVDSAAAAARLRFCRPALLAAGTALPQVPRTVRIHVAPRGAELPAPTARRLPARTRPVLGDAAAAGLRSAAARCGDPQLKKALVRLANRAGTSGSRP